MEKPVRSSFQNLSIAYECTLAIGNSLNMSEMLHEVIHTMVHKTNAHRGIIWIKNGEQEFQPVASAGINIKDVPAQGEIMDFRNVFNQILKKQQYVLRCKEDKDFLQYCPVLTEKEKSILIVPVTNVAILHLVYAGREIADEPLANLLTSLSKKLSVAIEACMDHKNIINEVQVRVEAEEGLKKKTEQLISSEKELQRLYEESEQARKLMLSILEDVAQKEETLRQSEEKFRTIFNSINDAVLIEDVETGAILDVNSTMCEMYGYSREEVGQLDIHALSSGEAPYSQQEALEWNKKAAVGESHILEWLAKHKSGYLFWVEISMKKAVVGLQERLLVVVRDITERKQAEEKEKEHIRNIGLLSETAMRFVEFPQDKDIYTFIGEKLKKFTGEKAIIVVNSIDAERDILTNRTVLGLGKLSEKVAGLLGKYPVGMTFDAKDQILSVLSDGKLHLYEGGLYGVFLKSVPETICNSIEKLLNIKTIYGIGFAKDNELFGTAVIFLREGAGKPKNKQIIETFIKQASIAVQKRQAEEALQESEYKMSTILNSMPDIILQLDTDRKILWANKAAIEMKADIIGQLCYEAMYGRNDPCPNCPTVKALKTGKIERGIVHLQSAAGVGESYWDEAGVPIKDAQGKIISMVNLARNVTERMQAEVEIRKLSHAVEQSPGIVMITDTKGIIEYVNLKFTQVTGYDSGEILGKKAGELGEETPEESERMWSTITSGGEWQGEFRNKRKNGEIFWESASISSIRNPEGVITHFIKVAEDMTKRKQAEEVLKKKMSELEIFNDAAVDRELIINELRKEINELLKKSGKEAKYEIAE